MEFVDCFTLLPTTELKCLDDGFVRLVDVMPRLALKDRGTVEHAIVQSARISFGNTLKSENADVGLIRYLFKNAHTSPFESVKFTFHLRCPMFVRTHFIRHRTANVNEYSLRYAEIKDSSFYHPSKMTPELVPGGGIRTSDTFNKQGSNELTDDVKREKLKLKLEETEALVETLFTKYEELVELGLTRELARFCLPHAQYTELYYTMDLNNFLKMISLRADAHAQAETSVYAKAMLNLVKPLIPTVVECLYEYRIHALTLSNSEIQAIKTGTELETKSVSSKHEYNQKCERLGLKAGHNESQ